MHDEKIANMIKELAAVFIEREGNNTSLITVTSCTLTGRGKNALIGVTVLPESMEKATIDFLKRRRGELRDYIKKNSRMGLIPFIEIDIDRGEKNRQKIDDLLAEK